MHNRKWVYVGLGVGLLALTAWVGFNLSSLAAYPAPYEDDAFFASIAAQFMHTGHFGLPLYSDVYGSATAMVHVGRLFILEFVAIFSVLGVGLFQARLVSFIGSLVVTVIVYLLGRDLWGHTEGVIAALVMLLSWHTFWSSHTTRPDTWIDAAGLTSLLLFRILQRHPSLKFGFGLGVFAALLLEIHLKTTLYLMPLGLCIVYGFGRQRTRWPILIAFAGGGCLASLSWLALHFLPNPDLMLLQWKNGLFSELVSPGNNLFTFFNDVILNGILFLTRLGWLEFAYVGMGLGGLFIRRTASDKFLLIILGIFTASYIALMPYTATAHLTLFWPLLSLATGAGLGVLVSKLSALSRWPLPAPHILNGLAILPLLLGYVAGDFSLAWSNRSIAYDDYAQQIRRVIPANASVVGESLWWFQFQEGVYTADNFMAAAYRKSNTPQTPAADFIAQVFRERAVQYVLLDERIGSLYREPPSTDDPFEAELVGYTEQHCHSLGTVKGLLYPAWAGVPELKTTTIYQCP